MAKCKIKTIRIDDEEYIRAADMPSVAPPIEGEEYRILILNSRGLTFVGWVDLTGHDEIVTIRDARCVIYWGAKQHLEELATGPTATTKLGAMTTIDVMRRHIVMSFRTPAEAWS